MNPPEPVLLSRAKRELACRSGVLVEVGKREIDIDPSHLARLDVLAFEGGKRLLRKLPAIRALKVRHLVHGNGRIGRPLAAAGQRLLRSLREERYSAGYQKEQREN